MCGGQPVSLSVHEVCRDLVLAILRPMSEQQLAARQVSLGDRWQLQLPSGNHFQIPSREQNFPNGPSLPTLVVWRLHPEFVLASRELAHHQSTVDGPQLRLLGHANDHRRRHTNARLQGRPTGRHLQQE